jgi:hypothetical protein
MRLLPPIIITARLLPGLRLGDGFISIEYAGLSSDGRQVYRYYIDIPAGEFQGRDLKSGVGGGTLQEGLESLLDFLDAAAESYEYRLHSGREGENEGLFERAVAEWAYRNSSEIEDLCEQLKNTPNLIEENER